MNNSTGNYFLKGFSLANKSLDIFFISVLLSLASFIPDFLENSPIIKILSFATFLLFFIQTGFSMSIPLFLVDKQQNKRLNYHDMWSVVLRNTKRMILPVILFLVLVMALGFTLLFITAFNTIQSGGDFKQIVTSIQNLPNSLQDWNPIFLVVTGLFSLLIFTPIYFSIENKGIFSSIKRSLIFSFKNLNFILILITIDGIYSFISTLIPFSIENKIWLITVLGGYLNFIMTASAFLYYKSKKSKQADLFIRR